MKVLNALTKQFIPDKNQVSFPLIHDVAFMET